MFRFRHRGSISTPAPSSSRCGRFGFVIGCLLALLSPLLAQTNDPTERELKAGSKALENEKFDAAISHFSHAILLLQRPEAPALAEDLAFAYRGRADAHYSAEHWKLAVADYNRCLELIPDDAESLSLRGVARKATGDYEGLLADEKKAAQLDPQYQYMVEAAQSTVLRRRGFLALWIIGCLIVTAGAIPFVKAIAHVARLEVASREKSG